MDNKDKLAEVKYKVNQVRDIMHDNINLALENTTKLETIELKSEELQQSAGIFKKNASELRKKMWWKNFKMKAAIFLIIASILAIVISIAVYVSKNNNK
jgi:hypothetical protein